MRIIETTLVALACAVDLGACLLVLRVEPGLSGGTLAWLAYVGALGFVPPTALLLRAPARERVLWTVGGLVLGFAILGGFSIGPLFLPAAGLLLLGALAGDILSPRALLLHVPLAAVACVLQIAVPVLVMHQVAGG